MTNIDLVPEDDDKVGVLDNERPRSFADADIAMLPVPAGCLHSFVSQLEQFAIGLASVVLSIISAVILIVPFVAELPVWGRIAGTAAAGLWIWYDAPLIVLMILRVMRSEPNAFFEIVASRRLWPLPLRWIPALWWLAHGLVIANLVVMMHTQGTGIGLRWIFPFTLAWTASGFAVAAVMSLTRSNKIRRVAWQCRALIDLALVLLASPIAVIAAHFLGKPRL